MNVCGQCKHRHAHKTTLGQGECFRFPPQIVAMNGQVVGLRLIVANDQEACGEFDTGETGETHETQS